MIAAPLHERPPPGQPQETHRRLQSPRPGPLGVRGIRLNHHLQPLSALETLTLQQGRHFFRIGHKLRVEVGVFGLQPDARVLLRAASSAQEGRSAGVEQYEARWCCFKEGINKKREGKTANIRELRGAGNSRIREESRI